MLHNKDANYFIELFKTKQLMMPGTVLRQGSLDAWLKYLPNYFDKVEDILEIGSFEASSAMVWLELFPKAHLICVDPFTGNLMEHTGNMFEPMFKTCETRFHLNMSSYAGRYTCFKTWSQTLLPLITSQFGLIYVDGCHEELVVKHDTQKCWDLCRVNGLLLWDDYDTEIYPGNSNKLRKTIDAFLKTKKDQYIEVFNSTQCLCIQKIQ